MGYIFFLSAKVLPRGFRYPEAYVKFVNSELPNLEPWHFFYNHLEFHFKGLKKRYPKRKIVPFARRSDNDDVACFDASVPSDNPLVIIIHDFASPGWENRGECKDFLDWLELAKIESQEWNKFWQATKKEIEDLSKTISYALRHAPWEYELELDDEGWVLVEELLSALRTERTEWANLTLLDLKRVINFSTKQRHEIKDGKIRALYGHSTPQKLVKQIAEPPALLFHGTSSEIAEVILKEGLKPMSRHYVHLSVDIETARQVGLRKAKKPKILAVQARNAYQNGVRFYIGNEHVWLTDYVPSKYIKINKNTGLSLDI